ncbi:tRNA dihydrouridine synthase DusB [Schaalia sp. 19OD2882]|uniref:tRNA dihydrouridine synthase DusB n=1 Tax=Schaalia sp. 19OD2882 TaxID=2794089 RepID=UPI001C1EF02C|nr:tRNA dihydrouridine synthase DusB [Schaalia sp. 19OD2882]QWW20710.1 tRNA dihydrouridine synthase DusB [Schaalia sp. 19OD2882]
MAGVTDAPFRRLCRLFGEEGLPWHLRPADTRAVADQDPAGGSALVPEEPPRPEPGVDAPAGLYVMEMVTSRALVEGNAKTLDMVRPDPAERVRSVQLYGVVPEVMAAATRILVERDLADHIDLNFGCPVPKVTRKGGGAALPWKKDLYSDLVGAVVHAAESAGRTAGREVPVTVKMRIGIDEDHVTHLDAARTAQDLGAAAVALHARTQTQHYSGTAKWQEIARLKDALRIPVMGNGDVFSGADAVRMMRETGCDAIVVGRGCQGRPWLFRDLVAATHGCDPRPGPGLGEVAEVIMRHARWCVEDRGDDLRAMREMRKHVGWYLRGFAVGGRARGELSRVSSLAELSERLGALDLDQPFPPSAEGPRGRAGTEKTPHLPHGWLDSRTLTEAERAQLHLAEEGADGG